MVYDCRALLLPCNLMSLSSRDLDPCLGRSVHSPALRAVLIAAPLRTCILLASGASCPMSDATSMDTIIGGGVLLQLAYVLLTDAQRREALLFLSPVTACMVIAYTAVSFATALGVARVSDFTLVDGEQLVSEPWRLFGCFLVYERVIALALHLWLLTKLGHQLEVSPGRFSSTQALGTPFSLVYCALFVSQARMGSRAYAYFMAFGGAAALFLRAALLSAEHRPALLTVAPLFAVQQAWAHTIPRVAAAASNARLSPKFLPWLMLASLACLEGPLAALPGLLGIGAASIYEAAIGLPAVPVTAPPPPAGAPPTTADATAGAPTADPATEATPKPSAPVWVRCLQFLAVVYLIAGLVFDPSAGTEAARRQCTLFASSLDLSEPLTAQLVSNSTSDRVELTSDVEVALRAYEWLLVRWAPLDEEARERLAAKAAATDPATLASARQALYRNQLQREVKQIVDEWVPTLETNSAQTDQEVLDLLLRQLGYPSNLAEEVQAAWLEGVGDADEP